MNTIVSHLEQQTVISHEWLAKVSRNGRYLLAVGSLEVSDTPGGGATFIVRLFLHPQAAVKILQKSRETI